MDYNKILANLSSFTKHELIDLRTKCNENYIRMLSQMMHMSDKEKQELQEMLNFTGKVSDEIISRG